MDNKKDGNFLANIHDDEYNVGKQRSKQQYSQKSGTKKPNAEISKRRECLF